MKRVRQFWQANRSKPTNAVKTGAAALAAIIVAFLVSSASQTQVKAASSLNTIKGAGTAGYFTKFLDNYTIGNSGIFEYLGNIGIGTAAPQAKLDVLGNIRMEGTGSALIFPDGSVVHNREQPEERVLRVQPDRRVHRAPQERMAWGTPIRLPGMRTSTIARSRSPL